MGNKNGSRQTGEVGNEYFKLRANMAASILGGLAASGKFDDLRSVDQMEKWTSLANVLAGLTLTNLIESVKNG